MLELNQENYYGREANEQYMSASQLKQFWKCEAAALAELNDGYEEPESTALLVGSYVDRYFEGTLEGFKAERPEIFKRDGTLKAEYQKADRMIERCERDEVFMNYMSGEKQKIFTGTLFGYPFKCKVDSLLDGSIVDLKTTKNFEPVWTEELGKAHFIEAYMYDVQMAIYRELVYQNTGKQLPTVIAAVSKEDEPDVELFYIPENKLKDALRLVENSIDRIADVKAGLVEPRRCGKCAYCRRTKVLTAPKNYTEEI